MHGITDIIRVLVVEDKPAGLVCLDSIFKQTDDMRCKLSHGTTMQQAIALLSSQKFDVTLINTSLINTSSEECLQQLRELNNKTAVIALAEHDNPDMGIQLIKQGVQDCLVKDEFLNKRLIPSMHYAIERKHAQNESIKLAYCDPLTGLCNQAYFQERLQQSISHANRMNESFALLYLNLDHFRSINDELGRNMGDKVLQAVAKRLLETVRETDLIARLSADEFVIIAERIPHAHGLSEVAEKIITAVEQDFVIDSHTIYISASIGVAYYPYCGEVIEGIINNAKSAMQEAKHNGRNQYKFHTREMNKIIRDNFYLENDLREASKQQQFTLNYQPKVDARTERIVGYEVLLRWQHPDFGMIEPLEFIPMLEKNGLIYSVGDWILETAIKQHKEWLDKGYDVGKLSLNISPDQLLEHDMANKLQAIMHKHDVPAECIELEITETLFLQDNIVVNTVLQELRNIGVSLAIDDFGTGYNSLEYLKRFKVDTLKIDKTFVNGIEKRSAEEAITSAILKLSNDLNIKTVAEGVETKEQLDFLVNNSADEIQGFYYSHPLSASDFITLFQTEQKVANYVW